MTNAQPQQTPLIDLLRAVPKDLRSQWPIQWTEDGHETGHAMCPIGRLAHEAADRIAELEAAHARYAAQPKVPEQFTPEELNIIRQWHNAIKDSNPTFLDRDGLDDDAVISKVKTMIISSQEQPK